MRVIIKLLNGQIICCNWSNHEQVLFEHCYTQDRICVEFDKMLNYETYLYKEVKYFD
jgi:hypothetical protein